MGDRRQQDTDLAERVAVLEDHDEAVQNRLHQGDNHFANLDRQVRALFAAHKTLVETEIPQRVREGLDEVMETVTRGLKESLDARHAAQEAAAAAGRAALDAEMIRTAEANSRAAVATADGVKATVAGLRVPDCTKCHASTAPVAQDRAEARRRDEAAARDRRAALIIQFTVALVNLGVIIATAAWVLAQR